MDNSNEAGGENGGMDNCNEAGRVDVDSIVTASTTASISNLSGEHNCSVCATCV